MALADRQQSMPTRGRGRGRGLGGCRRRGPPSGDRPAQAENHSPTDGSTASVIGHLQTAVTNLLVEMKKEKEVVVCSPPPCVYGG